MRITYYDESGDDGYPNYSSPLFALSALYMHYLSWQTNFERVRDFRRKLRSDFGLPVKVEIHTKYFLLGKTPYRDLEISEGDRVTIMDLIADLIGSLDLKIINVVVDPARHPSERFMIITDPGRVGAMRTTTRRIQRINYIPSRFGPKPYRREISALLEDPLQKDSKESYFIQLADFVAYVVYLYAIFMTHVGKPHGRHPSLVDAKKVQDWLDRMLPSLNTLAASDDRYGIKIYPRK